METVMDKRLFSIIKKCYQERFWQDFHDSQLVAIQMAKEKEPTFISIMGQEAGVHGFLIYRGFQQLSYLYQALKPTEKPTDPLIYQNCIAIYFEERSQLQEAEYQRIKQSGINFQDLQVWPVIVDFQSGYLPRAFQDDHILWLIHCLEALYDTAKELRQQMETYQKEDIKAFKAFPGRIYDSDFKGEKQIFPVPESYQSGMTNSSVDPSPSLLDDMEVLRLEILPTQDQEWEMDLLAIPVITDRDEEGVALDRPYYPFLFILAHSQSEEVLKLELVKLDDVQSIQKSFSRLLFNKDYRPVTIHIKKRLESIYIQSYFLDLFSKLDIQLQVKDKLKVIDPLRDELAQLIPSTP